MKKPTAAILLVLLFVACSQRPKWVGGHMSKEKSGTGSGAQGGNDSGPGEEGHGPGGDPMIPAATETGDMAPAAPGLDLVWKRYRAFENGLVTGLSLDRKDFCKELGTQSCIDKTHLTVLGGNEPYESGQYEPSQMPTVLTAIAVDRVVLAACSKRLELDRNAAATAVVFKHFPLSGMIPEAKQVEAQTGELYRRILARDPEAAEVKVMVEMLSQKLPADKLALLMCFAIATSVENILL